MDGMRNKDYLNEQDMSTVFVDGLLANNMEDDDDFEPETFSSSQRDSEIKNNKEASKGGTQMKSDRAENRSEGAEIVNISKAMPNMSGGDYMRDSSLKKSNTTFDTPVEDVNLSDIDAMMAAIKAEMPENVFDIPIDSKDVEVEEENKTEEIPDYIGEFLAKEKEMAAQNAQKEEKPKDTVKFSDEINNSARDNVKSERADIPVKPSVQRMEEPALDEDIIDEDDFDFDENPSYDDEIKIEEFDRSAAKPSEPRVGRRFDDEIRVEEFDRTSSEKSSGVRIDRRFDDQIKMEEFGKTTDPSATRIDRRFDDRIQVEEFDYTVKPSPARPDRVYEDAIKAEESDYTVKPFAEKKTEKFSDSLKNDDFGFDVKPADSGAGRRFSDEIKVDDSNREPRAYTTRARANMDAMRSEGEDLGFDSDYPIKVSAAHTDSLGMDTLGSEMSSDSFESLSVSSDADRRDAFRSDRREDKFESDRFGSDRREDKFESDRFGSDRREDKFESDRFGSGRREDKFESDRFGSGRREDKFRSDGFGSDRREDRFSSDRREDKFSSDRYEDKLSSDRFGSDRREDKFSSDMRDDVIKSENRSDAFESLSVSSEPVDRDADKVRKFSDTYKASPEKTDTLDMDAMISAAAEEDRLAFDDVPVFKEEKSIKSEPVAEPVIAPVAKTPVAKAPVAKAPEEKLDSILGAEVDALTTSSEDEEDSSAIMSFDDAIDGITKDMQNFLDGEDYDYTYVWSGTKETIIMKTVQGKAVALVYEDEEFASFEDNYTRDNRTGYIAIVNSFVKETIKGGSGIKIKRHKGTKAIDR
ncbi:hypothetical protein [Butyrivibrio sp. AE2005]|uniref:hypothetical protein n=1 Tax=Butyrivibrio sp. AE2005 TaxID=1496722 RepID=UPI00047E4592|nr:hypothetical protein [Butyrivibrio sp. AE2005]